MSCCVRVSEWCEAGGCDVCVCVFEGMLCGARFSSDRVWYRAILDEISSDKSVFTVHYVDFGNTEILQAAE